MNAKLLYVLSITAFAASLLFGIGGLGILCIIFYILSLAIYPVASAYYAKAGYPASTDLQMTVLTALFFLFFAETLIFSRNTDLNYPIGILAAISFGLSFVLLIRSKGRGVVNAVRSFFAGHKKDLLPLILVTAAAAALYISQIDIWFRGDSDTYIRGFMEAWDTWDLTPNTFNAFMIAGHLSGAYSFVLYMVSLPLRALGVSFELCVRITGLILVIAMLIAFYVVVRKITPQESRINTSVLMLILVLAPSFFGTSYLMDSDLPQTVFFMLLLMAFCCDMKVFKYLFATALVFTKETAIVLLAGIFVGGLIYRIPRAKEKGFIKKAANYLMNETYFVFAAGLFMVPLILGKEGWSKTLKQAVKSALGIKNPNAIPTPDMVDKGAYRLVKLAGTFVSHYNWVITLMIIIGAVLIFISSRKAKISSNEYLKAFLPVLSGSFVFFMLFSVGFFTYPHYRYFKTGYLMLVLFLAVTAGSLKIKDIIKTIALTLVCILVAIESFITTDPLTRRIYRSVECGNGSEVTMNRYFYGGEYYGYGFTEEPFQVKRLDLGDGFEHNLQVHSMQKLFEQALGYIDPDESTLIVVDPIGGELGTTTMVLFGTKRFALYYWHQDTMTLDHDDSGVNLHFMSGWTPDELRDGQDDEMLYRVDYEWACSIEQNYDRIYYIDMPFNGYYEDTYLNGKDILERVHITEGIWAIDLIRVR